MSEDKKPNRLGRGLAALLGEEEVPVAASVAGGVAGGIAGGVTSGAIDGAAGVGTGASPGPQLVPVEFLEVNPLNPRHNFDGQELAELAQSIREKGILQPILVRPHPSQIGRFQIIVGERRWRAAQQVPLHDVPVVVREFDDHEILEIALIENVQRSDLNPMEEAEGYQRLMQDYGYTQDRLASLIGKSRSHLANMLRLTHLSERIKGYVISGALSAGHARALIGADDADALAKRVADKGLSVRETERLVRAGKGSSNKSQRKKDIRISGTEALLEKDADTRALERNVANALGLDVSIDHMGISGGSIGIFYTTLEQLDDICCRLYRAPEGDNFFS